MTFDKVVVAIVGLLGIIFVYLFFLLKKTKEVTILDSVEIIVNGGYSPEVISIPKGKATKITFIRHDSNSCLEEVVLGDFKIRKHLPLNEPVTVEITPQEAGEFGYSCGMGMFHGKIVVK
ncbi:cupredoxin domain-containing protein [Candidatus Gottesmanbacteria bacterium]|nr:cupredoxin domain-containing protein [Candidatus Gottesmanbacteria bacterium]